MNKALCLFVSLIMSFVACAETYSWTGGGGVVDWSQAEKWKSSSGETGTVPGATDTVAFTAADTYADFTVTPPADFSGTIQALGNSASTGVGLGGAYSSARVKVINSNGATFTIGGTGILEAFAGIEDMLDSAFTGAIDIPSGVTLAPSATFAAGATFMGIGVLKPATTAQLENASAFRGTLDLRALGAYEVGKDASHLLGRKAVLGSGVTAAPNKQTTTIAPLDLSASKWTFNSALTTAGCVPSMDATGLLTLPHVNGVQNKTSAFLNRRFAYDESFVIRFRVDIKAGTGTCGFGIVMRNGEVTDVATGTRTTKDGAVPTNSHGVVMLYYNNWGGNVNAFERQNGASYFSTWGDEYRHYLQGSDAGFTLRNGSFIDVTASCHDGVLTVSFAQNGSMRTFRQSVAGLYADPRGAMFGFITHENDQDTGTVSLEVKISDFNGCVASDRNGQWKTDEKFALNAENYYLYLDYKTGSVTNSFRGVGALDEQGRVRICEGVSWYGAAVSKNLIQNKRFRLEWQDDIGTRSNGGQHTDVGFVERTDSQVKTSYGDPEVADGSGYGKNNRKYLTDGDPIKFCCSWYQDLIGITRHWASGTDAGQYTGTYVKQSAYKTSGSSNVGKWFYDGSGGHTVKFCNSSEKNNRSFVLTGQSVGTARRLSIVGGSNTDTGWPSYVKNWMGGISLSYWDEAYVPAACLTVEAPANATTTMGGVGSCAPIERVILDDAAARISFTGSVAFGETLEIVVPDAFLKTVRAQATLVDLSSATVDSNLPAVVKLVDSDGVEVNLKGRALTVSSTGVVLGPPTGIVLVVR